MTLYKQEDLPMIVGWLQQRRLPLLKHQDLPGIGMIEKDVACGFLVLCDNGSAFLDYFITNPAAGEQLRKSTVPKIMTELELAAKSLHVRHLLCNTKLFATEMYARNFGFESMGQYLMFSKELI